MASASRTCSWLNCSWKPRIVTPLAPQFLHNITYHHKEYLKIIVSQQLHSLPNALITEHLSWHLMFSPISAFMPSAFWLNCGKTTSFTNRIPPNTTIPSKTANNKITATFPALIFKPTLLLHFQVIFLLCSYP